MPDVRYAVPGVPAAPGMGISAFMPHFNRFAASSAQSYKYGLVGGPAQYHYAPTQGIWATARDGSAVRGPSGGPADLSDLALMGYSRSSDAPEAHYRDDYDVTYNRGEYPGAGMPISLPGDMDAYRSLIPVPAGNLAIAQKRDSALLAAPAVLNRIKQIPWWPRTWSAPFSRGDAR
jgi:hypothetical protein